MNKSIIIQIKHIIISINVISFLFVILYYIYLKYNLKKTRIIIIVIYFIFDSNSIQMYSNNLFIIIL